MGRNDTYAWSVPQVAIPGMSGTSDMTLLAFLFGDIATPTESLPVTLGPNSSGVSSSISVGDGTSKVLRYRINLNGTRYIGGSSLISATPTVVVGRQRYNVEQALFVSGIKDPIVGNFTGANTGPAYFGAYSGGSKTRVLLSAVWARALSDDEIRSVSENPWQIFAPRETRLFMPASAVGSTLNASASGTAQASGAASLSATVALAGVGVSVATGAASAAVNIPLSAVGLSGAGGSANAQAAVTISATALAQASAQAGLSASVLLAGAAAAKLTGNATLAAQLTALASGAAATTGTAHLTGSAPGELAADGDAVAGGSAVLQVTVGLQATGAAQAGGLANAQTGAAGSISAAGAAVADGVASTSLLVMLTAAGFVRAMGTGYARFDVAVNDFQNVSSNPKYIVRARPRHYTMAAARRNYTVGAL